MNQSEHDVDFQIIDFVLLAVLFASREEVFYQYEFLEWEDEHLGSKLLNFVHLNQTFENL